MKSLRADAGAGAARPLRVPTEHPSDRSARTPARLVLRPLVLALALALAVPPAPLRAQTGGSRAATQATAPATDESVYLNFVNVEIEQAVRAIGQFTGRQFVIDPRVKGTLTLVTERPVSRQQAYEQLLSALRLQGFTIVEGPPGGVSRVLPEPDAKLQGSRVIAPEQSPPRGDQIVTQVFELQYESATNMVPVLRPLIAPNNTIAAFASNNSLVITDYADNLRRLRDIIASLDRPGSAEAEMIQLRHGLALEIATIVNRVLDEGARAAGQAVDGGQRVQVLAEPRTNSLIIRSASRARTMTARQLIERLDQPSLTPGNINVVYLRNAQAVRLAQTLRAVISSDPTFMPQAGGTASLSQGSAFGGGGSSGILSNVPGQPAQPQSPQQPPQQSAGGQAGGGGPLAGLIQADPATNSIIITAPQPLYRNIRAIIDKLDARPAQVIIESLIAEVSADKAAEFGIQWQALGGLRSSNGNDTSVIGGTNFGGTGTNIIGAAQNLGTLGPGLNLGIIQGRLTIPGIGEVTNLGFLARALETQANANILSQPNIQTLDNEEAKFLVGQNVPFITGSFANTGVGQTPSGAVNPFQTFERRDIGLQLRVKPQISEGGNVRMTIYLEVSSLAPGTTQGGIITNKRSFESNVVVEDGNFVVLSGLIEDRTNNQEQRVPLLGSIPGLGALFRYENRSRTKTNTMVFLRPVVVRDEATSANIAADRYEYMRTQVQRGTKPDTAILRGYEPEALPVRPQRTTPPVSGGAASPAAPAGAQEPLRRNAPVLTAPPAATLPAAAVTPPAAAPSAAIALAPPPAAAPSPAAPPAGGGAQLIQVAATSDMARGRDLQRQLRAAGFDAYWEIVRGDKGDVVRVRVAVDRATRTVDDTLAALRARGLQPVLVAP
ncbi:MAG: type II secretion system secretin GspD [Burkholderiales bacterium]|nr:type II secretion system secretin GspD [Burkholderiales bacterium]